VRLDRVPAATIHCQHETIVALRERGAVLVAAELAGIAREALTRTVAYAAERVQFGRPIGSFQAIKHALAELHVAVTMAEHAVLYAAHSLDTGSPQASLATAIAKAKASDTAKQMTAAMIQYQGGIGFTWEHDAHLFYKRAKRLAATAGDAAHHRERVAQLTIDRGRPDAPDSTREETSTWKLSTAG
jgi:alkylation response protein AidB-like acyl-CoA dehydrogenase